MMTDALALNPQGLDGLKLQSKQNGGRESVRAAAEQFESFFLQMMLRNMRQTLSQDGPFDSQETKTFSDMFDQQVAQSISKSKGVGLADMLEAQMKLSLETKPGIRIQPRPYDLPSVAAPAAVSGAIETQKDAPLTPRNFVNKLWPHAVDAAADLGVSPHVLLAQAALESGWGKHELRGAEGNSHNLFNIKASKQWKGDTVTADTTEYMNGKAVSETANFRSYGSYSEAFSDYARLLKTNPRYAQALEQGGDAASFARGLQSGGYATDPQYAAKIMRVINSPAFREGMASGATEMSAV